MRKFSLLLLFLILFKTVDLFAQTSVIQAESHFIYNFTRYLDWPLSSKTGDFVIGVYGNNDLYDELKVYMEDKTVNTQAIKLKFISKLENIGQCHILFVGFSRSKEIDLIKNSIASKNICLISEKEGALQDGADINFLLINDKLKYEINTANLNKSNIKYSSVLQSMSYKK